MLREELRPTLFWYRLLSRICGPESSEVTGDWRKLHVEELHDLYFSQNIVLVIKHYPTFRQIPLSS
jgi:hypothetical protein